MEKELGTRLVKCFVWSVVLYGAEIWALRRNEQKQLEAFEMWVWRRMERVKWTDKIKNAFYRRYGKCEESSRQKKASDDRQHYDKWTV